MKYTLDIVLQKCGTEHLLGLWKYDGIGEGMGDRKMLHKYMEETIN